VSGCGKPYQLLVWRGFIRRTILWGFIGMFWGTLWRGFVGRTPMSLLCLSAPAHQRYIH